MSNSFNTKAGTLPIVAAAIVAIVLIVSAVYVFTSHDDSDKNDLYITNAGEHINGGTYDNVTISESVGDGSVYLNNVNIRGNLIVKGGGSHSIEIESSTIGGSVIVNKEGGETARVLASNTTVSVLTAESSAIIESSGTGSFDQVNITGNELTVQGVETTVGNVSSSNDVKISVAEEAVVQNISQTNGSLSISGAGEVQKVSLADAGLSISGDTVDVGTLTTSGESKVTLASDASLGDVKVGSGNLTIEGEGSIGSIAVENSSVTLSGENVSADSIVSTGTTTVDLAQGASVSSIEQTGGSIIVSGTGTVDSLSASGNVTAGSENVNTLIVGDSTEGSSITITGNDAISIILDTDSQVSISSETSQLDIGVVGDTIANVTVNGEGGVHVHKLVEVVDRDSTCSVAGSKHFECSEDDYKTEAVAIPLKDHTVVTDAAVAATCTSEGKTEGSHCSVCGTVIVEQKTVEKLGHDLIDHAAQAATCTEKGWEVYQTCSRCDYTTYKEISATGHTPAEAVRENVVDSTCTQAGSYDSVVYCSVCKQEVSRTSESIAVKEHTVVTDAAVAATCTSEGKTEGSHCSVCGTVIVEQNTVEKLGHDLIDHAAQAATCTEKGWNAYQTCSRCDYTTYVEIPATGHTASNEIKENELFSTYTREGSYDSVIYCSVCGADISRNSVSTPVLTLRDEISGSIAATEESFYNIGKTTIYYQVKSSDLNNNTFFDDYYQMISITYNGDKLSGSDLLTFLANFEPTCESLNGLTYEIMTCDGIQVKSVTYDDKSEKLFVSESGEIYEYSLEDFLSEWDYSSTIEYDMEDCVGYVLNETETSFSYNDGYIQDTKGIPGIRYDISYCQVGFFTYYELDSAIVGTEFASDEIYISPYYFDKSNVAYKCLSASMSNNTIDISSEINPTADIHVVVELAVPHTVNYVCNNDVVYSKEIPAGEGTNVLKLAFECNGAVYQPQEISQTDGTETEFGVWFFPDSDVTVTVSEEEFHIVYYYENENLIATLKVIAGQSLQLNNMYIPNVDDVVYFDNVSYACLSIKLSNGDDFEREKGVSSDVIVTIEKVTMYRLEYSYDSADFCYGSLTMIREGTKIVIEKEFKGYTCISATMNGISITIGEEVTVTGDVYVVLGKLEEDDTVSLYFIGDYLVYIDMENYPRVISIQIDGGEVYTGSDMAKVLLEGISVKEEIRWGICSDWSKSEVEGGIYYDILTVTSDGKFQFSQNTSDSPGKCYDTLNEALNDNGLLTKEEAESQFKSENWTTGTYTYGDISMETDILKVPSGNFSGDDDSTETFTEHFLLDGKEIKTESFEYSGNGEYTPTTYFEVDGTKYVSMKIVMNDVEYPVDYGFVPTTDIYITVMIEQAESEPVSIQEQLSAAEIEELQNSSSSVKISDSNGASILLSPSAMANLDASSDAQLSIRNVDVSELSETQQEVVGSSSVFEIDLGDNHDFSNGNITVTIPYELKEGEDPDNITVFVLLDDNTLEAHPCTYDAESKTVTFTTSHLSTYGVMKKSELAETTIESIKAGNVYAGLAKTYSWYTWGHYATDVYEVITGIDGDTLDVFFMRFNMEQDIDSFLDSTEIFNSMILEEDEGYEYGVAVAKTEKVEYDSPIFGLVTVEKTTYSLTIAQYDSEGNCLAEYVVATDAIVSYVYKDVLLKLEYHWDTDAWECDDIIELIDFCRVDKNIELNVAGKALHAGDAYVLTNGDYLDVYKVISEPVYGYVEIENIHYGNGESQSETYCIPSFETECLFYPAVNPEVYEEVKQLGEQYVDIPGIGTVLTDVYQVTEEGGESSIYCVYKGDWVKRYNISDGTPIGIETVGIYSESEIQSLIDELKSNDNPESSELVYPTSTKSDAEAMEMIADGVINPGFGYYNGETGYLITDITDGTVTGISEMNGDWANGAEPATITKTIPPYTDYTSWESEYPSIKVTQEVGLVDDYKCDIYVINGYRTRGSYYVVYDNYTVVEFANSILSITGGYQEVNDIESISKCLDDTGMLIMEQFKEGNEVGTISTIYTYVYVSNFSDYVKTSE